MTGSSAQIPEPVRRLVAERLDSIAELEVLLLLHQMRDADWSAQSVSAELRIDPKWAGEQLVALCERQLLVESRRGSGIYRFHPATPDLAATVDALALCYADRRVSIVALLYSKPGRSRPRAMSSSALLPDAAARVRLDQCRERAQEPREEIGMLR
jgi:hypothetical protein